MSINLALWQEEEDNGPRLTWAKNMRHEILSEK
jgi:hypothetical protein